MRILRRALFVTWMLWMAFFTVRHYIDAGRLREDCREFYMLTRQPGSAERCQLGQWAGTGNVSTNDLVESFPNWTLLVVAALIGAVILAVLYGIVWWITKPKREPQPS